MLATLFENLLTHGLTFFTGAYVTAIAWMLWPRPKRTGDTDKEAEA